MKKIMSIFILLCFSVPYCYAADFDTSVDKSIRKGYIEGSDLPPLPKADPGTGNIAPVAQTNISQPVAKPAKVTETVHKQSGKVYTIKSGTKLSLVSKSAISDTMKRGTIVSFTSQNPVITKEGVSIPVGTVFRGRVTDSHGPQIGTNGGLAEIHISEMYYNGNWSQINTKIASAQSKRVAFNDVKGEHRFKKNFSKSMTPGRTVYNATSGVAHVLLPIPVLNILAIVPWAIGTVFYTVNFALSPFITVFTKGGKLYLAPGSEFNIKFCSDSLIEG